MSKTNLEYVTIPESSNDLSQLLNVLGKKNIGSLFVEGGACLLKSFIDKGYWQEARIFTTAQNLGKGVVAPTINGKIRSTSKIKNDTLVVLKNIKNKL